jgi:mannitol-specific phosphotransferase system IIBC component
VFIVSESVNPQQPNPEYQGSAPGGPAPYGQPDPNQKPKRTKKSILFSILGILVIVAVGIVVRIVLSHNSLESQIQKSVDKTKKEMNLPKQVDSVTTLNDIKAKKKSADFLYEISSNVDPADVNQSALGKQVKKEACTDKGAKDILDKGGKINYIYSTSGGKKAFNIVVKKSDC